VDNDGALQVVVASTIQKWVSPLLAGHSVVDREFIYKYIKYSKIKHFPQTSNFAIYGRIARSDAWEMFLCIFQDFDFLKI